MLADAGEIVTLKTVLLLLTVMSDAPYWPLLKAIIAQDPPAHFGIELAVVRPLALTVQLPVGIHSVPEPQQLELQTVVLPSLRIATAFSWIEPPPDWMAAVAGAMVMPVTVLILVTVTLSTGLVMPLLVAVTVPEPSAHFGTSKPLTSPVVLTEISPVAL